MKPLVSAAIVCAWASAQLCGHDLITTKITWSKEVSRIIYAKCLSCHADNISLVTYQDARPWAKAIKEEVLERRMPPWGAVKGFGEFKNDISLSQEEITIIAEWVEGGAPEGDPNLLPVKPHMHPVVTDSRTGLRVRGASILSSSLMLDAIRPLSGATDLQVTARRPDGTIEPLLWLYNYKAEWKHTFTYRSPIVLPKGTAIETTKPLEIELITAAPKRVQ